MSSILYIYSLLTGAAWRLPACLLGARQTSTQAKMPRRLWMRQERASSPSARAYQLGMRGVARLEKLESSRCGEMPWWLNRSRSLVVVLVLLAAFLGRWKHRYA